MTKIMMCQSIKEDDLDKYDTNWVAEPKFDGSRILYQYGKFFTIDRFSSRPSRNVTEKFPELAHTKINAVLDGEIVAESGSFEDTGSRIHLADKLLIRISAKKNPVFYWVFDILEVNNQSVEHLPFHQRKELLKSVAFDNPRFKVVEPTEDIAGLWKKIVAAKREGIVLKKKDGAYEGRRSYNWLKCKFWKEDVVVVQTYEENPKGLRLTMDNGQGLQCAGGQSIPVRNAIDERGSIRVEIQYLTKDQKVGGKEGEMVYRFPSFKRMV